MSTHQEIHEDYSGTGMGQASKGIFINMDLKNAEFYRKVGDQIITSPDFQGYIKGCNMKWDEGNPAAEVAAHWRINLFINAFDDQSQEVRKFILPINTRWKIVTPNILNAIMGAPNSHFIYLKPYFNDAGRLRIFIKTQKEGKDSAPFKYEWDREGDNSGFIGVPRPKLVGTNPNNGKPIYDNNEVIAFWIKEFKENIYPRFNDGQVYPEKGDVSSLSRSESGNVFSPGYAKLLNNMTGQLAKLNDTANIETMWKKAYDHILTKDFDEVEKEALYTPWNEKYQKLGGGTLTPAFKEDTPGDMDDDDLPF